MFKALVKFQGSLLTTDIKSRSKLKKKDSKTKRVRETFSDSFRLNLLEVKNLKHEPPNIRLSIDGIRQSVNSLLNSCRRRISKSPVMLIPIVNLLRVDYKVVKTFLPQVPTAELVHQQTPMLLLQPFARCVQVLHQQTLRHRYVLYLLPHVF